MVIRNIEAMVSKWECGALVTVFSSDTDTMPLIRPAAFVYAIRGGFAWVEPSYADPYGASSPSLHIRSGEIQESGAGFTLHLGQGRITVYQFDERDPAMEDDAYPLRWFANHLKDNGIQWQVERERIRELIAPGLKAHAAELRARETEKAG